VDQPVGTGYSYSTDSRDIRHDEEGVSEDMYDFFQVRASYTPALSLDT
jgi:serine carboxypeptidase-like clade 4